MQIFKPQKQGDREGRQREKTLYFCVVVALRLSLSLLNILPYHRQLLKFFFLYHQNKRWVNNKQQYGKEKADIDIRQPFGDAFMYKKQHDSKNYESNNFV